MMWRKPITSSARFLAYHCLLVVISVVLPSLTWADETTNGSSSAVVIKIDPQHTWADLQLPQERIDQLQMLARTFRKQRSMKQVPTRPSQHRKSSTTTAVFVGSKQNGKLAAAEAIAIELQRPLLKINIRTLTEKYIGETEKNVSLLFRKAKTQGAILFFDEADALFGKRTDVSDAHDKYANIETNYLIERMNTYTGLVILSTNSRSNRTSFEDLRIHMTIVFPCASFQNCK